ncbi:MAG: [protein-PII] uridylyltransferase [Pseudomonadota bacterium]
MEARVQADARSADALASRDDFITALRLQQNSARRAAIDRLEQGQDGLRTAQQICAAQDGVVKRLAAAAEAHFGNGAPLPVAILAVGGYGRGSLAPGSDIDLLFLTAAKTPEERQRAEEAISFVLYALWDLQLMVGHAVRTHADCMELAHSDFTIRTSLLDMRFIAGDAAIAERLRADFRSAFVEMSDLHWDFISANLADRAERYDRAMAEPYTVEPNVKEGQGALRDIHALMWLAEHVYGSRRSRDLIRVGLIEEREWRLLQKARVFLWTARVHLHAMTGRREDRLSFDLQPELARRLRYADRPSAPAVERLMKHYFVLTKEVGALTGLICANLKQSLQSAPGAPAPPIRGARTQAPAPRSPLSRAAPRTPAAPLFRIRDNRLEFASTSTSTLRRQPQRIMALFEEAAVRGLDIGPGALLKALRASHSLGRPRARSAAGASLLRILARAKRPERILRRMNDTGVLERVVPEFGRLKNMVRYSLYHHYPVDEHLIRSAGVMADLEAGDLNEGADYAPRGLSGKPRAAAYLAILLHETRMLASQAPDSEARAAGGRAAARAARRLGLTPRLSDEIGAAIRDMPVMVRTAQRRDVADPRTAADFAEFAGAQGRLNAMMALGVCRLRALGHEAWDDWRRTRLDRLYEAVSRALAGGSEASLRAAYEAQVDALRSAAVSAAPAELRSEAEALAGLAPTSFWWAFPSAQTARYLKFMLRSAGANTGDEIQISLTPLNETGLTEVFICAPDRRGFFADAAGALAAAGASVRTAWSFVWDERTASCVFFVEGVAGSIETQTGMTRLEKTLSDALQGSQTPPAINDGAPARRRERAFDVPPAIEIHNDASDQATVIEITARDRPGVLFDLASALTEMGVSILSAHAATYGERAVDAFYVQDVPAHKITNPRRLEAIRRRLETAAAALA